MLVSPGLRRPLRPLRARLWAEDEVLYWLVLAVHVLVSLFLILVVLLQSGKGGDIASAWTTPTTHGGDPVGRHQDRRCRWRRPGRDVPQPVGD